MTHVTKIIELVGSSDVGWKEAVEAAYSYKTTLYGA
jgi:flavin-binding protein dodecin